MNRDWLDNSRVQIYMQVNDFSNIDRESNEYQPCVLHYKTNFQFNRRLNLLNKLCELTILHVHKLTITRLIACDDKVIKVEKRRLFRGIVRCVGVNRIE